MRNTFSNWERQENYARVYNLKGLEISTKEKTKYLGKYFLKYLNRRISEEAKVAKAGSNFKKVNKARKTLNPKLKIGFSEHVRLRFRGSPLKGTGSMHLQNPWIDVKLQAEITGAIFFECSKGFRDLKLNSKVNYDIAEDKMMAEVTKHIIKGMDANVTYENRGFSRHDNLLLQVRFSKTF